MLLLCTIALPSVGMAQSEEEQPAPKATMLSLGSVSGGQKAQVMLPVFVTPYPAEVGVGNITALIEYPATGMKFVKAEKSFLLDGVNATYKVEPAPDMGNETKSVLKLQVATKGEPRKALREGLIVTLFFGIDADAKPGKFPVKLANVTASSPDGTPKMLPLVTKDGVIEIVPPEGIPYVGCFFFSH